MSTADDQRRVATFRLGRDLFAVPIERVERVLRYDAPRRVPGSLPWVEGVVEYGGRVVPVVNLSRRFDLPDVDVVAPSRILVVSAAGEWMGIVVDAVLDVRPLDDAALERPPSALRGAAFDAMRGIIRRDGELVIVLDVGRLVAPTGDLLHPDEVRGDIALR